MLKNALYTIDQLEVSEGNLSANITLNPSHEIFQGHFPSQPVLPGVCLIAMLKDLVQGQTGATLMTNGSNIKYLKMVDPRLDQQLKFEVQFSKKEEKITVSATSFLGDGSANFKFKGAFM
jgi:3-hydroxyacyl-[acyl-carrier-protein] dehydratase